MRNRVHKRWLVRDCFWYYGGVGADPLFNIAYPDAGAVYWAAYYRRPAGSKLTLEGTYPHARYFSFISYDRLGQPVDGIADYQIAPDQGSANPYAPGARRNTPEKKRGYTVSFDHAANYDAATGKPEFTIRDPRNDEPRRNALRTIPTASLGQTPLGVETGSDGVRYETDLVLMRVYVPDRGKDLTGGVGMPRPALHEHGPVRGEGLRRPLTRTAGQCSPARRRGGPSRYGSGIGDAR
ncbi:hypothetical protein ACIQV3_27290 [Streptomyces sp. NPDC099050]|uniref:hypothetical protein n=1 Tax=Streptomyces sp. NPDC099050 TaxID=3366100 RepID=UPI0038264DA6